VKTLKWRNIKWRFNSIIKSKHTSTVIHGRCRKPETLNLYWVKSVTWIASKCHKCGRKLAVTLNLIFGKSECWLDQTFGSVPEEVLCVPFMLSPVLSAVIPENKWWHDKKSFYNTQFVTQKWNIIRIWRMLKQPEKHITKWSTWQKHNFLHINFS